jgi:hypothetical protein
MRRRNFTIGLSLAATMRTVRAQQPTKQHRIAIVVASGPVTALTTRQVAPGKRFGRSCAAWAMSKDKTSPSSAIPARGGQRAMAISLARSSAGTRM